MGIHDRDWARNSGDGGAFWSTWPLPVRILTVLVVGVAVGALVVRNWRAGPMGGYDDEGAFNPVMMALAAKDRAALFDMIKRDPELLEKPFSDYDDGPTLFDVLVHQGDADLLISLIEAGGPMGAADAQGRTWLHRVARLGRADLVRALLKRGASVDAVDSLGFTPLFDAAMMPDDGGLAAVEVLLAEGARAEATSADGQTPLTVAEMARNFRVLSRLRQSLSSTAAQP